MSEINVCEDKLHYDIHSVSSCLPLYSPENIRENCPKDQSSRWSSNTNNSPQFITLKLQRPAVVKSITFGKYEKTHVCNLKKFKVFAGLAEDNMIEIFEGGLKNDCIPETFPLRHTIDGNSVFATRYIKIMPLLAWGPSFNFSIWFVELNGVDNLEYARIGVKNFNTLREKEVIRLCLKHFRQQNYTSVFNELQRSSGVSLEDPLMTRLYEKLVVNGDFGAVENVMEEYINRDLMCQYISQQEYRACWRAISIPENSNQQQPGRRGGHQMVIDPYTDKLYLFGGWDGKRDLSDMWSYHFPTGVWTLICEQSETVGGPSPRSCHKMVIDPERRQIFTIGRYLDASFRICEHVKKDFYVYDIDSNRWTLITDDTSSMGGPQLTFDHQMCLDIAKKTIYVFGGRILPYGTQDEGHVLNPEPQYSGMYSYHIPSNTWTWLMPDCSGQRLSLPITGIRSRVAHSMLFHPGCRKLFIFGGQRNKEYLNNFLSYAVDTGEICIVNDMTEGDDNSMPAAGFTQRATIDPDLDEIYILSGLSKEKQKREDHVQHSFWVYSITRNVWTCVYKNENNTEQYWNKMQHVEPCPRFAHQLVYDHVSKVHYMFGGNPGKAFLPRLRLDDFWELRLARPSHVQLLQRCKLIIRTHRFEELSLTDKVEALKYLQTELSNVIDHEDKTQKEQFHHLASMLFCNDDDYSTTMMDPSPHKQKSVQSSEPYATSSKMDVDIYASELENNSAAARGDETNLKTKFHLKRCLLFNKLMDFFPENMVQPKGSLTDLISL